MCEIHWDFEPTFKSKKQIHSLFFVFFSYFNFRTDSPSLTPIRRNPCKIWCSLHGDVYWPAQKTIRISKIGHIFGMISPIEIEFVYLGLPSRECMFSPTATVTTVTGKSIGSRYMFPSLEVCLILSINLHSKQYINDHKYIYINWLFNPII